MVELDVTKADRITLQVNDEDVEVIITFPACPNVILVVNDTDTIHIFDDDGKNILHVSPCKS